MRTFNPHQQLLLSVKNFLNLEPFKKHEILFDHLDLRPIRQTYASTGRPAFSRSNLVRALIYKNLRGLPTLSDLVSDLNHNQGIASLCGFDITKPLPSIDRFSRFLKDTPNEILHQIHKRQVRTLIKLKYIAGKYLSIDSTAVKVKVKENNPKRFIGGKFDKKQIPKGDPDCRLGVIVLQKNKPFKKNEEQEKQQTLYYVPAKSQNKNKIEFFWGYKNHAICDAQAEIPIWETTKPANISDIKLFLPLFRAVKRKFKFSCKYVLADSLHDAQYIYEFVRDELKSKAFIPINPRSGKGELRFSPRGWKICVAGLEMMNWGTYFYKERGYRRHKFVCPIRFSKKALKAGKQCPINHPRFLEGKGCIANPIELEFNPRFAINRNSGYFKRIYRLRVGSERVFSRLLTASMQNPSVRGLNAVANHCTLAHITVLAVAIAAIISGHSDQARFIKSFLGSKSEF